MVPFREKLSRKRKEARGIGYIRSGGKAPEEVLGKRHGDVWSWNERWREKKGYLKLARCILEAELHQKSCVEHTRL